MTRKDYVAIAKAINTEWENTNYILKHSTSEQQSLSYLGRQDGIKAIQWQIANILTEDNPRFDWMRFERACFEVQE